MKCSSQPKGKSASGTCKAKTSKKDIFCQNDKVCKSISSCEPSVKPKLPALSCSCEPKCAVAGNCCEECRLNCYEQAKEKKLFEAAESCADQKKNGKCMG